MSPTNYSTPLKFNAKHYQQLLSKGRLDEVIDELELFVKNDSLNEEDITQCLYMLAVAFRLKKQNCEALNILDKLSKIAPNYSRMLQEKGYNLREQGDHLKAAKHFYQATQINPALLSAWLALKPIYEREKQYQALSLCEERIQQLSSLPKPLLAATDMMYEDNLELADSTCRHFLQQNKHHPKALLLLAEIAIRLKATLKAEFILETCAELYQDDLDAKYQLFKIYSKLGKFENALAISKTLTSAAPTNMFYQVALATATQGVGNVEQAIAILENICKQFGEHAQVFMLLGHAYKTIGNIAESVASYKKAYELESTLGDAFWSLANTKTYQFSDSEITHMEKSAVSAEMKATDKIHFHFALGKSYEDNKEFAQSFKHYQLGNQAQHVLTPFNIESHTQFVEHQIKTFTSGLKAELESQGCNDTAPIFIVGMPRAGSTLLEQILASHSQVDGTMELHEILALAGKLSKKHESMPAYPLNLSKLPENTLAQLGKDFIERTQVYREGAPYFIDKMPNNYMHIGLIKSILPNAKIIDARRSPMACCFSGYKQLFGDGQEFSYDLNIIGTYYKNYINLMDHWNNIYPDEILLVNNEDVIDNTEHEIKRLLSFCELPFEDACLRFYENKRTVKTPSAQQVRQPIYTSGKNQWENYKPYLSELLDKFS